MASWKVPIVALLILALLSGCIGQKADSVQRSKVTPAPTPTTGPLENETPRAVGPLDVQKFKGTVDGAATPLFALDLPTSEGTSDDIKLKANGSLRFEVKFAPSGGANQLHVEVSDLGSPDATGQPKVLGTKDGGPKIVIDLAADKLVGVKELGYRIFYASGSAGQGTPFEAAATAWNGTIPVAYSALTP
ncbi:MAG: hypothetical protein WDA16_14540 [Candidatus Thermoplasmatota archaeon]